jgi:predicted component of type VI protein secretion system
MAVLIGMSSKIKGRKFELEQSETFIGRNNQNHVPLDDDAISGRHCSVVRENRKFMLVDLGSTNGTRLNGGAVTKSPLRPKDIIQVGGMELMFDGQDIDAPDAPTAHDTASIEVASEPVAIPDTFRTASPFGSRRDSRKPWVIAIAILIVVVLAALAVFIVNLFGNN